MIQGQGPIVVGVDGSPESRRAVARAWRIAKAAHADLVPVHAVPDLWLAEGLEQGPELPLQIREALIRDARTGIERFLKPVVPPAARRTLEVRTGPAAIAIADVARQRQAALVVLGGRHHGKLARAAGRSTARYLVRQLDVPLLVVGPSDIPSGRVLAAVDLSTASIPTLRAAQHFAGLLGARLRVVHAVQPLRFMFGLVDALDQKSFEERSRQAFDRLTAPLGKLDPQDRVLRVGPVAETIVGEASSWPADVIVVGSHGKGLVERVLIGSTTERLVNALPASLLVVPTWPARKPARALTRPRRRARAARAWSRSASPRERASRTPR
jgi:nucleotide-binding universal stress UspA family protein